MPAGIYSCSKYGNFKLHRISNTALVFHGANGKGGSAFNKQAENFEIVDAKIAFFSFSASDHFETNKVTFRDSHLVGYSEDFDCNWAQGFSTRFSASLEKDKNNPRPIPHKYDADGHIAIAWPGFANKLNCAPADAKYSEKGTWASKLAESEFDGLIIENYNNKCGQDKLLGYNNAWRSANYPLHFRNTELINSESATLTEIPRPDVENIHVGQFGCVDMECDGKKHFLVVDHDGGFFGEPGSIIPISEFGWDDPAESARGLGDYRIPKAALTHPLTGDRIEVADYAPNKGTVRDENCVKDEVHNYYICQDSSYMQMMISSMDHDSEERRIGPLAVISETGYVDLYNGPLKADWGKRSSVYQSQIKGNLHYDVWFTATPPQITRMKVYSGNDNARVALWFPHPQRMDVYKIDQATGEATYVQPSNMETMEDGSLMPKVPTYREEFMPQIGDGHASNYQIRDEQLLFISITGDEEMLEIRTAPVVLMSFGFPSVNVDDFFEENLIANLAGFFGLPPSKIRIVNVIRENSLKRRKRSVHHVLKNEFCIFASIIDLRKKHCFIHKDGI